jgi:hypothetical protein
MLPRNWKCPTAYVRNSPLHYSDPAGLDRYSVIANAAAVHDTKAEGHDKGTFMKIGRGAADIAAGAADALPLEPTLVRNGRFLKATGMADTDSGVYKATYWNTYVTSLAVPVGGAANAARGGGRAAIGAGEAANLAKSVLDPLAKTPFRHELLSHDPSCRRSTQSSFERSSDWRVDRWGRLRHSFCAGRPSCLCRSQQCPGNHLPGDPQTDSGCQPAFGQIRRPPKCRA